MEAEALAMRQAPMKAASRNGGVIIARGMRR